MSYGYGSLPEFDNAYGGRAYADGGRPARPYADDYGARPFADDFDSAQSYGMGGRWDSPSGGGDEMRLASALSKIMSKPSNSAEKNFLKMALRDEDPYGGGMSGGGMSGGMSSGYGGFREMGGGHGGGGHGGGGPRMPQSGYTGAAQKRPFPGSAPGRGGTMMPPMKKPAGAFGARPYGGASAVKSSDTVDRKEFTCGVCDIKVTSILCYKQHIAGKKHLDLVKQKEEASTKKTQEMTAEIVTQLKKYSESKGEDDEGVTIMKQESVSPTKVNGVDQPPRPSSPLVSSNPKSKGLEHIQEVTGYFCKLCQRFFRDKAIVANVHCASDVHLKNLSKAK